MVAPNPSRTSPKNGPLLHRPVPQSVWRPCPRRVANPSPALNAAARSRGMEVNPTVVTGGDGIRSGCWRAVRLVRYVEVKNEDETSFW